MSTQVPSRGSAARGDDDAITAPLPLLAVLPGAADDEAAVVTPRAHEPELPVHAALRRPDVPLDQRHDLPARRPGRQRRIRRLGAVGHHKVAAAMVGVGALLIGALVMHFAGGSDQPVASDSAPGVTSSQDATAAKAADQAKLTGLLPPGLNAANACRASESNPAGVAASVECKSRDLRPDVPATAIYRLADRRATLDTLLAAALNRTKVQVCPGNIQSPGAWHRTANPNTTSGTVFCGMSNNVAVVGWTDTDRLLFAEIHSTPVQAPATSSPAMTGLYQWWAMNS